jgi:hypothetical protein
LFPVVRDITERAPFTQPRALAIVVVAISAWKTASAVILLFVLSGGDCSSPAHHDKRGVGHNLFDDRRTGRETSRAHHTI